MRGKVALSPLLLSSSAWDMGVVGRAARIPNDIDKGCPRVGRPFHHLCHAAAPGNRVSCTARQFWRFSGVYSRMSIRFQLPLSSGASLAWCRRAAVLATALALAPALTACSNLRASSPETLFGLLEPYKVDVVQGNVVTQEVMAQIQPGLGRMQVKEILGTPLLADPFHTDRWDYVFSIHRQGVADQQRRVSVFFKNDAVERFETQPLPTEREFVAAIDKPLPSDRKAPQNLSEAEVAALPPPPKAVEVRKLPQGAVRAYPPLEPGQP
jgi:outer membrane protein assembly factor BamE